MKNPRTVVRAAALLAVTALVVANCAGQSEPDIPAAQPNVEVDQDVASTPEDPPEALAFESDGAKPVETTTQRLVAFEVAWQCDLARFAVDDLADLDAILAGHRMDFDVNDADYAAFQAELAVDADLRAVIATQTSECLEAGESVQL